MYASSAANPLARLRGCDHYLNADGDITARVHTSRAPAWRIGVGDPADPTAFLAVSDPHTGDLLSVTIIGPTLLWDDVFAATTFARGGNIARWVTTHAPGYDVGWSPRPRRRRRARIRPARAPSRHHGSIRPALNWASATVSGRPPQQHTTGT